MVIEVTEFEMILRFNDSLKKSASKAEEFVKAEDKDKPPIFVDFMNGLKVAAGSAHQLAHARENPNWLTIRDFLEKILDAAKNLPVSYKNTDHLWMQIKTSLEAMIEKGNHFAYAKPMSRQDVLTKLDFRQTNLDQMEQKV